MSDLERAWLENGPQNLKPEQLQQAWSLQMVLKYQEKVRELSELLRQEESERNQ